MRSQGIKVNVSHILGKHTLRAGIDFRDQVRNDAGANGNSAGNFTFDNTYTQATDNGAIPAASIGLSYAAFQLGIPTTMSIDNNTSLSEGNPYYGWYGMDTWRVTRNMTLTLGLRMEYETGPTERYNRAIGGFDPTAQLPIAGAAQAAYAANPIPQLAGSAFVVQGGDYYLGSNGKTNQLWQNQLMFLPRVAAAWQVTPKTVIRAGYGIYYDTLNVACGIGAAERFLLHSDQHHQQQLGRHVQPRQSVQRRIAAHQSVPEHGRRQSALPALRQQSRLHVSGGPRLQLHSLQPRAPAVQRWRGSVQRQIGNNMLIEATYWGQWATRSSRNTPARCASGAILVNRSGPQQHE